MLFNSNLYLFVFLPFVLTVTALMKSWLPRSNVIWLAMSSLAFYAYWDIRFLPVLMTSAGANFAAGRAIAHARPAHTPWTPRRLLVLAIAANVLALAYFKYLDFVIETAYGLWGVHHYRDLAALPLGISFFTFTQIAYLVDVYRRRIGLPRPADFLLFVSYFPHLIAGPILHYQAMQPQFHGPNAFRPSSLELAKGMTVLSIGLFKKVVIADNWAVHANHIYEAASQGQAPLLVDAWVGALAFAFQLYFDFSGYCDMAAGASLLLGIRLPSNFESPYKARSIIEFWQRWHVTLSSFLRDYLYIPLGGNRLGAVRRNANLMITMTLGGLWHGAGWTFVLWGALHGLFLMVNHLWRSLSSPIRVRLPGSFCAIGSTALTFIAVVFGWVLFRSDTLDQAQAILRGMLGLNGSGHPMADAASMRFSNVQPHEWLVCVIVWLMPNVRELFQANGGVFLEDGEPKYRVDKPAPCSWTSSHRWALLSALLLWSSLMKMNSDGVSTFLYFQF